MVASIKVDKADGEDAHRQEDSTKSGKSNLLECIFLVSMFTVWTIQLFRFCSLILQAQMKGFSKTRVLPEVSLLPDKVRVMSSRRAIAMATGVIDWDYKRGQKLKQVLVVVTSGFHLSEMNLSLSCCFHKWGCFVKLASQPL